MIFYGASSAASAPKGVTLITLGFAALVAGIILPRIDGKFSAGSSGVTADLIPVHIVDATFTASARAIADSDEETAEGAGSLPITVGDVWDALESAGFRITSAATGKRLLTGPHGRTIVLHVRDLLGFRPASKDLIEQLASWGIQPVASGKYHPPPGTDPSYWMEPYSAISQGNGAQHDRGGVQVRAVRQPPGPRS
jgi:hypothetical protein